MLLGWKVLFSACARFFGHVCFTSWERKQASKKERKQARKEGKKEEREREKYIYIFIFIEREIEGYTVILILV